MISVGPALETWFASPLMNKPALRLWKLVELCQISETKPIENERLGGIYA